MKDSSYDGANILAGDWKKKKKKWGGIFPRGSDEQRSKEVRIPFFSSMVTVSLAHFMRNLDLVVVHGQLAGIEKQALRGWSSALTSLYEEMGWNLTSRASSWISFTLVGGGIELVYHCAAWKISEFWINNHNISILKPSNKFRRTDVHLGMPCKLSIMLDRYGMISTLWYSCTSLD